MEAVQVKKIGILGATLETQNLGVSALAVGAVGCALYAYPDASPFFLDYAVRSKIRRVPAGPLWVDVPLVNMRFSKRFWLPNNIVVLLSLALLLRAIPLAGMRRRVIESNRTLRAIDSADLFLSLAGGDSFSDIYGPVRFIYTALPQLLILLLGKRFILLPQTYGPFRGRLPRAVARWIVSHAEDAWCRDYGSLAKLMTGTSAVTHFCYDIAFAIEPIRPAQIVVEGLSLAADRNPDLVGLNISGLLFQGGYTGKNEFGLQTDYKTLIFAIVDQILADAGTSILLVPHVLGKQPGSESDEIACRTVFAQLRDRYPGRIGLLGGVYTPNEIRYVIGLCGFFIGSRMHACIGAISQNVPAVSIAYSDKFLGVMRTLGIESFVVDPRELNHEQILSAIRRARDARDEAARDLEERLPAIREAVWDLLVPCDSSPHYAHASELPVELS